MLARESYARGQARSPLCRRCVVSRCVEKGVLLCVFLIMSGVWVTWLVQPGCWCNFLMIDACGDEAQVVLCGLWAVM